jgi:acylphosphatase
VANNGQPLCYTKFTVNREPLARRYIVSGRVQGVGFRNFVEHVAGKIGVEGFVRNRRDGSVEVYGIGSADQLAQLRSALEKGPMMASVSSVQEQSDAIDPRYLGTFTVEYTGD